MVGVVGLCTGLSPSQSLNGFPQGTELTNRGMLACPRVKGRHLGLLRSPGITQGSGGRASKVLTEGRISSKQGGRHPQGTAKDSSTSFSLPWSSMNKTLATSTYRGSQNLPSLQLTLPSHEEGGRGISKSPFLAGHSGSHLLSQHFGS